MKWARTQLMVISLGFFPRLALAQGPSPSPLYLDVQSGGAPASAAHPFVAFFVLISVTIAVLLAIAKLQDLRKAREEQTVELEARISDALLASEAFVGSTVVPSVHVPFWGRTPATIKLFGKVRSSRMEQSALHLAEQAASRIRSDVVVEDRMVIVPSLNNRVAGVASPERAEAA